MLRLGSESVVVFANYCSASVFKASGASACMLAYPFPCCQNQAPPGLGTKVKWKVACFPLAFCLAVRTRLELATPCVTGMYSNQTELPDLPCASSLESGCKSTHFFEYGKIFFYFSSEIILICLNTSAFTKDSFCLRELDASIQNGVKEWLFFVFCP